MFGWVGTLLEGRLGEDVAEANSRIVQQQAKAQADSIDYERERLQESQRGIKAKQRMSVASRGGLMGGTDLLTLAEQAKEMQMDNLEMVRQRDIALITGQNKAQMMQWEAKKRKRAGYWTAAAQMAGDAVSIGTMAAGAFGGGAGGIKQTGTAKGSYGGGFSVPSYQNSRYTSPMR